jgi:hypothetical protein
MCTYVRVCVCTYALVCARMRVCVRVRMCVYAHVRTCALTCARMRSRARVRVYAYARVCMRARIRAGAQHVRNTYAGVCDRCANGARGRVAGCVYGRNVARVIRKGVRARVFTGAFTCALDVRACTGGRLRALSRVRASRACVRARGRGCALSACANPPPFPLPALND